MDKGAIPTSISSKDVSPLSLDQLSNNQFKLILHIEQRLAEAKELRSPSDEARLEGFASAQDRFARVLLLDGDRGTGKTSLLLTLLKHWHGDPEHPWFPASSYKERLKEINSSSVDDLPSPAVRVLKIIDFDSLPPRMPLVAAIVQTLRPLVERYDTADGKDYENPSLLDSWHQLFRIATLAWAEISQRSGFIEELLDREEQVQDWHHVAEHWQKFVWEVLNKGKTVRKDPLDDHTILVVMIDDVDLQVLRVKELLPALRLLYHPRLFFLVAAHTQHMQDMLELDYYGQQVQLSQNGDIQLANWPRHLARSAIEKVFPTRNRWKMDRLSLSGFLAFPTRTKGQLGPVGDPIAASGLGKTSKLKTFYDFLKEIVPYTQSGGDGRLTEDTQSVGDLLHHFAIDAEQMNLPGVMTYRKAHQLYQCISGSGGINQRSTEVLAGLLSGNILANTFVIEVSKIGELASLYRRGRSVYGGPYEVILSANPDFVFSERIDSPPRSMSSASFVNDFNYTSALIATLLQEADYPVDATGLRWDTYVSLAWTEWPRLGLSFAWTRLIHPRPDQLLKQTQYWSSNFLRNLAKTTDDLEFCAYAWLCLQRKWSSFGLSQSVGDMTKRPFSWDQLLNIGPEPSNETQRAEWRRWYAETLPLLARPELGFPAQIQKRLLDAARNVADLHPVLLRNQRRRLVTDAFVAKRAQSGDGTEALPKDEQLESWIKAIDQQYKDRETNNWWEEFVETET